MTRLKVPCRWTCLLLTTVIGVVVAGGAAGPAKAEAAEPGSQTDDRLQFMKSTLADYQIAVSGAPGSTPRKFTRIEEPLLRWDNPVSNVPDGTLFLWTDETGRPGFAAQVFIAGGTKDLWLHEFQSLAVEKFRVLRGSHAIWTPERGGIDFQPVPDAPAPAETKSARLVQMRQIARRFAAEDDFEGRSRWELRLLTTPVYRYGDGRVEDPLLDGALFAYAHGTDPEALLLVEVRNTQSGPTWVYALAPMTGYALRVTHQGEEVWSVGWRKAPYDLREPFVCLPYKP